MSTDSAGAPAAAAWAGQVPSGSAADRRPGFAAGHRAAGVVAHRELLRQAKHPGALVTQALQMVFFLLVYAVGFGSQMPSLGGLGFAAFVFPGLVAINIVTTSVTAGITYAWDREYGFLRE